MQRKECRGSLSFSRALSLSDNIKPPAQLASGASQQGVAHWPTEWPGTEKSWRPGSSEPPPLWGLWGSQLARWRQAPPASRCGPPWWWWWSKRSSREVQTWTAYAERRNGNMSKGPKNSQSLVPSVSWTPRRIVVVRFREKKCFASTDIYIPHLFGSVHVSLYKAKHRTRTLLQKNLWRAKKDRNGSGYVIEQQSGFQCKFFFGPIPNPNNTGYPGRTLQIDVAWNVCRPKRFFDGIRYTSYVNTRRLIHIKFTSHSTRNFGI